MKLSPKILSSKDHKDVLDMLVEFYTTRPNIYGNWDGRDQVYKEFANFIDSKVEKKGKHLDFGTGTWKIVDSISEHNFQEVYGLDYFSEEDLIKLNEQVENKDNVSIVSYKENDIIPFADDSFDSISSLCVIEHVVYLEKVFEEMNRVLKPGGTLIIECPNWSGPNPAITGMIKTLKGQRFWLFNNFSDAFTGFFRSFGWYFQNLFSSGKFIRIFPRIKDKKIDFEFSDDDVVHLCQPLSIKKYFKARGYKVKMYNRGSGSTTYSKIFNLIFPSLATTNQLVFVKSDEV